MLYKYFAQQCLTEVANYCLQLLYETKIQIFSQSSYKDVILN